MNEQPVELKTDFYKPEEPVKEEDSKALVSGYTVGLKENGEFVFEIHGDNTGLVQLLGLHEYAKYRIGFITDENQGYGSAGIIRALNHLGKQVGQLAALFSQSVQSRIIQP